MNLQKATKAMKNLRGLGDLLQGLIVFHLGRLPHGRPAALGE
jgi:hypothetical protein